MVLEAWITIGVVLLLVAALASNRVGTDTAIIAALTALMFTGVIAPVDAIRGFADPGVLMIAAMFVIATGLSETGAMEMIASRILGRPKSLAGAQVRMMAPVAGMSAFMNNTPIVAMYLPIVHDWARKLRISPSKLFMPLAFAANFGGACTLIGTSTNIVVNQLYVEYFAAHADVLSSGFGISAPGPTKQFWWIGVVGVPSAVLGLAFVVVTSRWLLPERTPPDAGAVSDRKYTVEVQVESGSAIVGKSVEEAGLRQLPGLFLTEIERDGNLIPAVSPDELLMGGDVLRFVGIVESVVDLLKIRGLVPATDQVKKVEAARRQRSVVEAVVSHNSPLVRRTVRESQFRTRYNAAIIAVHRGGQQIRKKVGDIILQPGDTLLLSTHSGFVQTNRNSGHFYLVSNVDEAGEVFYERAWVALAILGLLVALLTLPIPSGAAVLGSITGHPVSNSRFEPVAAAFFCAVLMILTRCCTGTTARRSINWQVLLVIGGAIGIGKAMGTTGAAAAIAQIVFGLIEPLGPSATLLSFSLVTAVMSQAVTNKGAAVLMFPIATALATDLGVSPEPFVVTLMVTAASSFLTPVGFVTNLMVYGPGGYKFFDYVRLGLPLTVLVALLCTVIAPAVFPFAGHG